VSPHNSLQDKPEIKSVSPVEIHAEWAWRDAAPELNCEITLGFLAQQFNQRSADRIVVPPTLASQTLFAYGGIRVEDPQAIPNLLTALVPGIKVEVMEHDGRRTFTVGGARGVGKHSSPNAGVGGICEGGAASDR
jgi:hypothetical protein